MMKKLQAGFILVFSLTVLISCGSETRRDQRPMDERTQVTFSEVRDKIQVSGESFEQDISRRLDVLQVFIDDVMEKYRVADEERQKSLEPRVRKLNKLMSEVRGTLQTYSPDQEQLSGEQRQRIIDQMQELRATYHDLVQRLGITWH